MALISLRSVAPARELCSLVGSWPEPPQPIAAPIPAYPGQAFEPLYKFMPSCRTEIPEIQLKLGVIENATVIIQSGLDGLILDRAGVAVRESTYYTEVYREKLHVIDLDVEGPDLEVRDVFIAFDGSWWVYYHWLLFCLGAAGVANKLLPGEISIAVPDWSACASRRPSVFSRRVFDEVQRVVDPGRLLSLPDGTYRARRAYFFYVDGGQPSDVALHSLYRDVFSGLRPKSSTGSRSRLFVSRGGRGASNRVTASDEKIFDEVIVEYGMSKVRLENLTFQAQIKLFSNASVIVSPHGSGLANLVFAPPDAKVLELHTEFAAPGLVLPWFYIQAAVSGLAYAFLNRESGDFEAERLRDGLWALGVSRPPFKQAGKVWRIVKLRWDEALTQLQNAMFSRLRAIFVRMFRSD